MSLHDDNHLQRFLENKEMNEMYISTFLMSFAQGLISIFVPVYLYFLGFSIQDILFYFLLISLFFIIFTPISIKIISKIGVKHSMSLSIPFLIIYFSLLDLLAKTPVFFYILPAIMAVRLSLYNISFHLNYIEHSDAKTESKEVSTLNTIPVLANLLSPLFGGFIIFYFGYDYIYTIGSIILSLSIMPLLLTKDKREKIKFKTKELFLFVLNKENLNQTLSFTGYATAATIGVVIWPIFLTILAISTKSIGAIISISGILTIVIVYFLEKNDTPKNREKIIKHRTLLHTVGWVGRIFTDSILSAFLIDSYKKIAFRLLYIPWSIYSYDIAKKQDYFKYIVYRELIFNASRVALLPIFILIFYYNFYPFILSFILAAVLSSSYSLLIKRKIYYNDK